MKNLQREHSIFILLGGLLLALLNVAVVLIVQWSDLLDNIALFYAILYGFEFAMFCLAMWLYRYLVSKMIWFSKGMLLLVYLTLFKILLATFFVFITLTYFHRLAGDPLSNLVGVAGIFMRGFIIELPLIALAAKLFETDIFEKPEDKNDKILDDL